MKILLSEKQKQELETCHKQERDKRKADRIKAVLLRAKNWSQIQISQALRIGIDTVHDHLCNYLKESGLETCNGGSSSKLNKSQTAELIIHLESVTYDKVCSICEYVYKTYGILYSSCLKSTRF